MGHAKGGQCPEFIVNERNEFLGGTRVTVTERV
jgi:hypothetical protein